MVKRKCLFCGDGELSNEHIIAKWLLKELNIYDKNINLTHFGTFKVKKISNRFQSFSKLVNGLVCERCNNGWMSELENNNKDIIKDFLNYEKDIVKSIYQNKFNLVKRCFKNAILYNYSTNYRNLVPRKHFNILYNGSIPQNVFVHLGFTTNEDISFLQSEVDLALFNKRNEKQLIKTIKNKKNSYKIAFQFKNMLIKVVYYKFDGELLYIKDDGALEIFPKFYIFNDIKNFNNLSDFFYNGHISEKCLL